MNQEEIMRTLANHVHYPILAEFEGDFAMFSRPDSGSEKTSYPAPPFSAAKGMMESILYMPSVLVIPTKVKICKPVRYYPYSFNYRGELRKSGLIKDGSTCQIKSNILVNVCYQIEAMVVNVNNFVPSDKSKKYQDINHAHSYQSQFNRRLKRFQNAKTPCLGLSEFLVSYAGIPRPSTTVQDKLNFTIPSMLLCCFDSLNSGTWAPHSIQNVEIRNGELSYVK